MLVKNARNVKSKHHNYANDDLVLGSLITTPNSLQSTLMAS